MVIPATPLARSPWARVRWLILAPHADDETLGTGALIAACGARATLAVLTDGAGSHPCPTPAHRTRLVRRRRHEAALATRRLGRGTPRPMFLDWPDANPHASNSVAFARSARRLTALIRRARIDAIATTAAAEPHCDHSACYTLAAHAVRSAKRRVALFEYVVWGERPRGSRTLRTPAMHPGRRRLALNAHASQLTPAMGDGFRLPRHQRRMASSDLLHMVRHAR